MQVVLFVLSGPGGLLCLLPREWPCCTTAVRAGEFDRIVDLPRADRNVQFTG